MRTIIWFREDLRLSDNTSLTYACQQGEVIPVFFQPKGLGGASKWWLHHSLANLDKALSEQGSQLNLFKGKPEVVLPKLCKELNADQVVWGRVYSPSGMELGAKVKEALDHIGIIAKSFNDQLLIEPTRIKNKQGSPFKVFTPFWRHCLSVLAPEPPLPVPALRPTNHREPISDEQCSLNELGLLPRKPNWAVGFEDIWKPGESGATHSWSNFLEGPIARYKDDRDIPHKDGTSKLSPHLAFGEISVRQLWFDLQGLMASGEVSHTQGNKFLSEIGWREFSRYLLVHFPYLERSPFNSKFDHFPWGDNQELSDAWTKGETGYPIVDAGMRELWKTGYMHNRVRMIVASFLTKHCLTHWHVGMDWFWDTLLDADIGNNTASWQWAAGCGADAAPYFRIFNPILQGEKFDKEGSYVKKWVPELSKVPNKFIHKPWECDSLVLKELGVVLGEDYPFPVVDHKQARETALSAYAVLKTID